MYEINFIIICQTQYPESNEVGKYPYLNSGG